MKIIVVFVGLLAVGLATEIVSSDEREARQFVPIYPAIAPHPEFARNPLLPYLLNPNSPLFRQINVKANNTVVVTNTSTITVTCTLSTTACGSGRRRRHILSELIEHQFEEVQPSPVEKIEITPSAMNLNERHQREANAQLLVAAHPNYYNPDASFGQGNYPSPGAPFGYLRNNNNRQDSISLPAFWANLPGLRPALAIANNLAQNFGPPFFVNNANSIVGAILQGSLPTKFWFPGQSSSSSSTVTKTSCHFVISYVTSTPACSTTGTLLQCPQI